MDKSGPKFPAPTVADVNEDFEPFFSAWFSTQLQSGDIKLPKGINQASPTDPTTGISPGAHPTTVPETPIPSAPESTGDSVIPPTWVSRVDELFSTPKKKDL